MGGKDALEDMLMWKCQGKADRLVMKDTGTAAVLSCVAEIDTNDFWLTSDANYCGTGDYVKNLKDAKVTCALIKPSLKPFNGEWDSVLMNLKGLMNDIVREGSPRQGVFAIATGIRFKVRHVLFAVSIQSFTDC